MRVLVVKGAFGNYSRGNVIKDPKEIAKILAGESAHHVMQTNHEIALANTPKPNTKKES